MSHDPAHASGESVLLSFFRGKSIGYGKYKGFCPAHADDNPSLDFEYKAGRWVLICRVCQDQKKVFAACSQEVKDVLSPPASRVKTLPKAQIDPVYKPWSYRDESGVELYQTVRMLEPDGKKSFRQRHRDTASGKWVWSTKGVRRVPYRLPELIASRSTSAWVGITEGEKCVDALVSLGFTATCNAGGAGKWSSDLDSFVAGRNVVLFEDNDEAGRAHVLGIAARLVGVCPSVRIMRWPGEREKYDVGDFVAENSPELARDLIAAIPNALPPLGASDLPPVSDSEDNDTPPPPPKMRGKKKATRDDYVEFALSLPKFADVRRCIVSEKLCVRSGTLGGYELWVPWNSKLRGYLRGAAMAYGSFFTLDRFDDALEWYSEEKCTPRLMIDIPEWDGRDRIAEVCAVIHASNVSRGSLYELVKHWGCGIFKKIEQPEYQNVCPIFQGSQGCGKDTLIKALVGGFGQYFTDLDLRPDEAVLQLHSRLVFNIPEFDRASKRDIADLRQLLTAPSTDVRLKHGAEGRQRAIRASFCASGNLSDLLVDGTGNRRFWLFNVAYAGFKNGVPVDVYPGHFLDSDRAANRLQIVAQFRALALEGFTASADARAEMGEFMTEIQPDNPEDLICDMYENKVKALQDDVVIGGQGYLIYASVRPVIEEIAKTLGRSFQTTQRVLVARRYRKIAHGHEKLYSRISL